MKNITDYLEAAQVKTMENNARACSMRDFLIIRVMYRTGVRVSELVNIRPQDIERDNQVINIVKAKGDKQRRIYLDTETLYMLANYIHDRKIPDDCPVFGLRRVQIFNIVKKYGRIIGVSVHPHSLRHSYAINWVRQNQDIRRLQLVLGHSNLNTTQTYLQFRDDDIREVYNKLEF
jgi:integrase/recombinase XerD